MADDRRIIFSSYVVPKEGEVTEETETTKWIIAPQDNSTNAIGKSMGGKGTITDVDNSGGENHSSMAHANQVWGDWNDNWDGDAMLAEFWDGTSIIGDSSTQLVNDGSILAFCYIKNLGDEELQVSIDVAGPVWGIEIPAGGSVHFRGGDDAFKKSHVYVKTASGTTTIEYLISSKA